MKELQLPDQFYDGMQLCCGDGVRIWGYNKPGSSVMVSFLGEEYVGKTEPDGVWAVWLKKVTKCGPVTMYISDEQGNEEVIANIEIVD